MSTTLPPTTQYPYYLQHLDTALPTTPSDGTFPTTTYSCTFDTRTCTAQFSTYAAWTAHETSHGKIPASFFCGAYTTPPCTTAWPTLSSFTQHVRHAHKMRPLTPEQYTNPLNHNVIYEDYATYWCGFCRAPMQVHMPGAITFANCRFGHLQSHFLGRGGVRKCRPAEWLHPFDSWQCLVRTARMGLVMGENKEGKNKEGKGKETMRDDLGDT